MSERPTVTGDLAVWLRAQLDAQEQWLRTGTDHFMDQCQECGFADQIAGSPFSQAFVLADIAAKKDIVKQVCDVKWGGYAVRDVILRLLARPYRGRDGWREEWEMK